MLNLINKETRQIPGWPVVQGRGVDRVRSTQPPPRGWETLLVISRCLASLSHPLWHSPSQPSLSKAARYVHHIRTRQSRIMIDALIEREHWLPRHVARMPRLSSLERQIFQNSRRRYQQDSDVFANRVTEKWNYRCFDIAFFRS